MMRRLSLVDRLRRGALPQHPRVLGPRAHGDLHADGRRSARGTAASAPSARGSPARSTRASPSASPRPPRELAPLARRRDVGQPGRPRRTAARRTSPRRSARSGAGSRAATVEVLIPDFCGNADALETRACRRARHPEPQHRDGPPPLPPRAARTRATSSRSSCSPAPTRFRRRTGLAHQDEVGPHGRPRRDLRGAARDALATCARVGCDIATVGQYLQPYEQRLPVERYYTPEEFEQPARRGRRPWGSSASSRGRSCAPPTTRGAPSKGRRREAIPGGDPARGRGAPRGPDARRGADARAEARVSRRALQGGRAGQRHPDRADRPERLGPGLESGLDDATSSSSSRR